MAKMTIDLINLVGYSWLNGCYMVLLTSLFCAAAEDEQKSFNSPTRRETFETTQKSPFLAIFHRFVEKHPNRRYGL